MTQWFRHDRAMKRTTIAVVAGVAVAASLVRATRAWRLERTAKTVFPARDAASLMNPLRRLKDPPGSMIAAFAVARGDRVLELGPGPGYFTREAARVVGDAGRVVALDLQPAMIGELTRRLPPDVVSRVRPVVGDAMRLPFADASFDRAYMVAVLGEIPDAAQTVAELRRILRPGGSVAFSETLSDPDFVREGELRHLAADAGLHVVERRQHLLGFTLRFGVDATCPANTDSPDHAP